MELGISRDGLHHILEADNDQYLVSAGKDLAKVRTTSQMWPCGSGGPRFAFLAGRLYDLEARPLGMEKTRGSDALPCAARRGW
jgi:hypothetical protein